MAARFPFARGAGSLCRPMRSDEHQRSRSAAPVRWRRAGAIAALGLAAAILGLPAIARQQAPTQAQASDSARNAVAASALDVELTWKEYDALVLDRHGSSEVGHDA